MSDKPSFIIAMRMGKYIKYSIPQQLRKAHSLQGILYLLILIHASIQVAYTQESHSSEKTLYSQTLFHSGIVTDISEDRYGMIWLSTWSGLLRFDGSTFERIETVTAGDHLPLSSKVSCLYKDANDDLWAGTNYGGAYRYLSTVEGFEHLPLDSTKDVDVWTISEDSHDNILFGTDQGLYAYNRKTGMSTLVEAAFLKNHPREIKLRVNAIEHIDDSTILIGTTNGVYLGQYNDQIHNYDLSTLCQKFPSTDENMWIYSIVALPKAGNYLIGTTHGLVEIRLGLHLKDTFEIEWLSKGMPLADYYVEDFIYLDDFILLATSDGFHSYDPTNRSITKLQTKYDENIRISGRTIKSLYRDSNKQLWAGTLAGFQRLDFAPPAFTKIGLSHSDINPGIVSAIAKNKDQGFFLTTNEGGLFHFQLTGLPESLQHFKKLEFFPKPNTRREDYISDMVLKKNEIWVSTQGSGLIALDRSNLNIHSSRIRISRNLDKTNGLADNHLMCLHDSRHYGLWLGYWENGLGFYDYINDSVYHFSLRDDNGQVFDQYPVVKILETNHNDSTHLWLATNGSGLLKLFFDQRSKRVTLIDRYSPEHYPSISNDIVNDLLLLDDDHILVSTERDLFQVFTKQSGIRKFELPHRFKSSYPGSLLLDSDSTVWIGSKEGLLHVSHFQSDAPSTVLYDHHDGAWQTPFILTGIVSKEDQLLFGGNGSLLVCNKRGLHSKFSTQPSVELIEVQVFPKVNSSKDSITQEGSKRINGRRSQLNLAYNERFISLSLRAIDTKEPNRIVCSYMMEGIDDRWQYSKEPATNVRYNNLNAGTYTLRFKACHDNGNCGPENTLEIVVKPPLWRTTFAYILYALLLLLAIAAFRQNTIKRTRLKHQIELQQIENEKYKELNELKLRFFTNISHELRTPLTLIISPLEQMLIERSLPKTTYKVLSRMHFNATKLLKLINDLLDIRKSEAGLLTINKRALDIQKFTHETCLYFQDLARTKGLDYQYPNNNHSVLIQADPTQLEKVLFNLLSNAFKFSHEPGKIEVTLDYSSNNDFVILAVSDHGIGIDETKTPFLFDRFYQASDDSDFNQKGTGIGLAVAQNIVKAHQGEIKVSSVKGQGSIFYVFLPKQITADEGKVVDHGPKQAHDFIQHEEMIEDDSLDDSSYPDSKIKVHTLLIVDDNEDIRSYLREQLELDYTIIESQDGEEGLAQATQHIPDLILADVAMPKMDGIKLCGALKSDIRTSHIPLILLTARTSLVFKVDGYDKGADDYITKPFNVKLVKTRIRNLLRSREELRKKYNNSNVLIQPSEFHHNSLDEQFLDRLKSLIESNLDDANLNVNFLSDHMNLSRMQLNRKLKALTGETPSKLIRRFRLEKAKELLKTNEYNVNEVTYMVGYNDLKSFRTQFVKEYGMFPSDLKK